MPGSAPPGGLAAVTQGGGGADGGGPVSEREAEMGPARQAFAACAAGAGDPGD